MLQQRYIAFCEEVEVCFNCIFADKLQGKRIFRMVDTLQPPVQLPDDTANLKLLLGLIDSGSFDEPEPWLSGTVLVG